MGKKFRAGKGRTILPRGVCNPASFPSGVGSGSVLNVLLLSGRAAGPPTPPDRRAYHRTAPGPRVTTSSGPGRGWMSFFSCLGKITGRMGRSPAFGCGKRRAISSAGGAAADGRPLPIPRAARSSGGLSVPTFPPCRSLKSVTTLLVIDYIRCNVLSSA